MGNERTLRGHFDGVTGSVAGGWAADLGMPDRTLAVEFFAVDPDGQSSRLGRTRANQPREDLQSIGLRNVNHGFYWRIPFPERELLLSARFADDDTELPGSPIRVTPGLFYEGHLDGVVHGVLRGWASAWDPNAKVEVEVFVDGRLQATVPARSERRDLLIARVGKGFHGFDWLVPRALADGKPHEFACRIAGTEFWLDGSPRIATVLPGDRHFSTTALDLVRGHARRPEPEPAAASRGGWLRGLLRGLTERRVEWRPPRPERDALAGAQGEFWQPLSLGRTEAPPALRTGRQPVRLMVPVWGDDYIEVFCRACLPSFLSPNNLPYLAAQHDFTAVFLTRRRDREVFERYPAFQRLEQLGEVVFNDIDEVLARYFEPAPTSFNVALTYAYFHGIRALGAAALDTNFVFWNGDFLPADGLFRTLSDLISAGVRATIAPSLRVDMAVEEGLAARRSEDGAVLDIPAREWVELALRFPHPTVKAQTMNRYEERMIVPVSQLYWSIDPELMVARQFFMFMLHIRPERLWDEVYGHCDYVFLPEMVPSGEYHFEVESDRMLIVELQHNNRDVKNIVLADEPMSAEDIAMGVAPWITREHMLQSRQLVVFNSAPITADLGATRHLTDGLMEEVYELLPEVPLWHNGHFYWRQSIVALGLDYRGPGPDHPRSHLAAALRWTGYDIDILRESWPDSAGAPAGVFDLELPFDPAFDAAGWLARAHRAYHRIWQEQAGRGPEDPAGLHMISGHFHGFGWGLVEPMAGGWARRLGPDGRAVLLLRVAPGGDATVVLTLARSMPGGLRAFVNGREPAGLYLRRSRSGSCLEIAIDRAQVDAAAGALELLLCAPPGEAVAFSKLGVRSR